MAGKGSNRKKARTHKESQGKNRGARKTKLTDIELILMGKGAAHRSRKR